MFLWQFQQVFLAMQFKDHFLDDVDADTIHAGFCYPVVAEEQPSYNWNLSNYDLIVIDELSMVPIKIFDHIVATVSELPIHPIILLAGDDCQLQPIENIDGQIQSTKTAMRSEKLPAITNKVILTEQHRNDDDEYSRFLTGHGLGVHHNIYLTKYRKTEYFLIMSQLITTSCMH